MMNLLTHLELLPILNNYKFCYSTQHVVVVEWSRAPAISFRKQGDVGLSLSPAKIPFSNEIFLNNSRVDQRALILCPIMIIIGIYICKWTTKFSRNRIKKVFFN